MQNVTGKKSIYDVKRKACVSKDKYLLASDSIKKTKKQKQLLKNKLNASRKESCCIKQDIKTSLDTLKECKKESIKTSEKRKNDRVSQIINDLKRHNKRINQLNTKHSNFTNISTLKRLRNETEEYMNKIRNETEEYMNKTRKYRDEVLHIVNISNLSSKTCINASTQVDIDYVNIDTDFDSTKSHVNESTQVDIDFVNVCTQTEIKSDDVSTQVDDDDDDNDDNNDSNDNNDLNDSNDSNDNNDDNNDLNDSNDNNDCKNDDNNDDNNDTDGDDDDKFIKRDKQIIKRDKPDRSDNVEYMPCNVIIREVPSIDEYKREVLLKMIKERKNMFDNMIFQLHELLEEINISEKRKEFKILCRENKIKSKSTEMKRIGNIYALNIIMKNVRDLFGNRPCFRDISYTRIKKLGNNDKNAIEYYNIKIAYKNGVILLVVMEIDLIMKSKYDNAKEFWRVNEIKDIKALDQAFTKIDWIIGYTRRIISEIPNIIEKVLENDPKMTIFLNAEKVLDDSMRNIMQAI